MWQNGILFLFFLPVVCAMVDGAGCSTDPLPAVAVAAAFVRRRRSDSTDPFRSRLRWLVGGLFGLRVVHRVPHFTFSHCHSHAEKAVVAFVATSEITPLTLQCLDALLSDRLDPLRVDTAQEQVGLDDVGAQDGIEAAF